MAPEIEVNDACSLLESDALRHIVALKMLSLYGRESAITVRRDGTGWAMLIQLPIAASLWDRRQYPTASEAIILDGSAPAPALAMLELVSESIAVVKTSQEAVGRALAARGAELRFSILSFTAGGRTAAPIESSGVEIASVLTSDAVWMFGHNGYGRDELDAYFAGGARRFSVKKDGRILSAGFVFQNYKHVWEIGGVYTEPDCRGQGLAKRTVGAALAYLESRGCTPRYQAETGNEASLAVARACGLEPFLRQDHHLWDRRPKPP